MTTDLYTKAVGAQSHKRRVGLIVPPANTAVEDEYQALGGDTFAFSTTRYGVYEKAPLRERLNHYASELPSRRASFGDMELHAMVAACSGNHYLQGFEADLRECNRASESTGTLCVSTTVAVVAWLRRCGIDTITVASPYVGWLTELSVSYWASAGFRVSSVINVVNRSTGAVAPSPYLLGAQDIVSAIRDAEPSGTPILLVGTGMHTRGAVAALRRQFRGRQFYSSNSCGVDWLRLTTMQPNPLADLR